MTLIKMTKLRTLFLTSAKFRFYVLIVFLALALGGFLIADNMTKTIESNSIRDVVEYIKNNPRSVNILKEFSVLNSGTIVHAMNVSDLSPIMYICLVQVTVHKKNARLAVVDSDGKILQWQWDWRYLSSDKLGQNTFIMTIPRTMSKGKKYSIQLLYNDGTVNINSAFLLPIDKAHPWKFLFYNDVFNIDDDKYVPKRSAGYKISPTKLNFNPTEM